MIQYYLDLQSQVKNISDNIPSYSHIQKIYSTAYFVSMAVRSPGKTWYIYLGRGGGNEGVWLGEESPPATLRRKDNFLEYLRKHLSSCSLVNLELDVSDRVISLNYQKFGQIQTFMFFWKARKLYFLHQYHEDPQSPAKLLLSWHGKVIKLNEDSPPLWDYFNEVGRGLELRHDLRSPKASTINQLLQDEASALKIKGVVSRPGFMVRKIKNIEQDLHRAAGWKKLESILASEQEIEGYDIDLAGFKFKFSPELNPFERRNLVFEKIKKLKRGEQILQQRLNQAQDELQGKVTETKFGQLEMVKPVWGREPVSQTASAKKLTEKSFFQLLKYPDFTVGVGLSAIGNDQLRNSWATKEDCWMHLDGLKSAHVIIKLKPQVFLSEHILGIGASILAHFSHFNDEWIPIVYTTVKNLKGVSGSPGMVTYKKEKHLRCLKVPESVWKESP